MIPRGLKILVSAVQFRLWARRIAKRPSVPDTGPSAYRALSASQCTLRSTQGVQFSGRLTLLAALALTGCHNDAESTAASSNANIDVQRLFTVDGCTVYRFWDNGARYFASCPGSVQADHYEGCGKNCTRRVTDEIPTGASP